MNVNKLRYRQIPKHLKYLLLLLTGSNLRMDMQITFALDVALSTLIKTDFKI